MEYDLEREKKKYFSKLTGKASSCPFQNQTPAMVLLLFSPHTHMLANAFLRNFSKRWYMPEEERNKKEKKTVDLKQ